MGGQASPVDPHVERFRRAVHGHWRIEQMILFGSRARGDALVDSDYDIILVSPDFLGVHFIDRMAQALAFWDAPYDLDVICYTPEEFERKKRQIGTVQEAVREGVALA